MIQTILLIVLVLLSAASLAWSIFSGISAYQQRQHLVEAMDYLMSATVSVGYVAQETECDAETGIDLASCYLRRH